jgi:hypothetical protein
MYIGFNKMKSLYKYIEMWDCLSNIFFLCVVFFFLSFSGNDYLDAQRPKRSEQ